MLEVYITRGIEDSLYFFIQWAYPGIIILVYDLRCIQKIPAGYSSFCIDFLDANCLSLIIICDSLQTNRET